jgi:predicted Ser/Thr protein kinase
VYDDDFPDDELGDEGRVNRQAWLNSMAHWKTGMPEWKGESILGEGTFGIAGKWTYTGKDSNIPKHIVVKESKSGHQSLRREARMLELLSGRSNHIVRMYGGLRIEPRRAIHGLTRRDIDKGEVESLRIFMEYCQGGDLEKVIKLIEVS